MSSLLTLFLALTLPAAESEIRSPWSTAFGYRGLSCSAAAASTVPDVPGVYYGIDLVTTKRVPGTGQGGGLGRVTFAESPYGVSVTGHGTYVYDVDLKLERIKVPKTGVLTGWITTSDLSEVIRLGPLGDDLEASGQVEWNKFLVLVTLEPSEETSDRWSGPIVMRGMSRSGMMHTLAGHGPFEKEPCSKYGF